MDDDIVPRTVLDIGVRMIGVEPGVIDIAVERDFGKVAGLAIVGIGVECDTERSGYQRAEPAAAAAGEHRRPLVLQRERYAIGAAVVAAEIELGRPGDVVGEVDPAPYRARLIAAVGGQLIFAVADRGGGAGHRQGVDRQRHRRRDRDADRRVAAAAASAARAGVVAGERRIGERINRGVELRLRRRRGDHHRPHCRRGDRRAVGEHELVDRRQCRQRGARDRHPIIAADEAQDEIVARSRHDEPRRGQTVAEPQHVGRGRGVDLVDRVAAIASGEGVAVVAEPARQDIIAAPALERHRDVADSAEVDRLVADAAMRGLRVEIGQGPARAVGEGHCFDAKILAIGIGAEQIAQHDAVAGGADQQHDVAPVSRHANVGRHDPRAEAQRVGGVAARAAIVDDVLAITTLVIIGVAARTALEQVVALAAGDDVRTPPTLEMIVAEAAVDFRAHERAAGIPGGGHDDMVVTIGRADRERVAGEGPGPAVGEADRADHRIGAARRIDQGNAIVGARDPEHDVAVRVARRDHVLDRDPGTEAERRATVDPGAGLDPVDAIAAIEDEHVRAALADQRVVAAPALDRLGARGADQPVVARPARCVGEREQRIARNPRAVAEFEPIDPHPVAGIAQHDLVAGIAEPQHQFVTIGRGPRDDELVCAVTGDLERIDPARVVDHVATVADLVEIEIVARAAAHLIVAGAAADHVGARRPEDDVGPRGRLIVDRTLDQRRLGPDRAVREFDRRDRAAAERTRDDDLIAGRGEIDDQILAVDRGEPDFDLRGIPGREAHPRVGDAAGHLDPVDPVAGVDD